LIGFLRGTLVAKHPPQLTLEVGGVGYEIEAPMSTFYGLPATGETVRLLTHLVIREDAHILYGFATEPERHLFRSLLKVSGVGPKIALGILSGITADAFALCVQMQDVAALTRIPGVGRKTAERLLIEMRDRLAVALPAPMDGPAGRADSTRAEAFSALVALGYKPPEAERMLRAAKSPEGTSTEDIIRRALQGAAKELG
jgi:Holliday junction DNA helicase RuvA